MIIESLVRLGRPLIGGSMPARKVLLHVSGISDNSVRNFYRRVIVVEVDATRAVPVVKVHEPNEWGHETMENKKPRFTPDLERAVAAPFSLISGGNPLAAQGCYPVPTYLVYDRTMLKIRENVEETDKFLEQRLAKTVSAELDPELRQCIAEQLHAVVSAEELPEKDIKGVLTVLVIGGNSPYSYSEAVQPYDNKRSSPTVSSIYPDQHIVADLGKIVQLFWEAKSREGAEEGVLDDEWSSCVTCGRPGPVVSAYTKAWPWLAPTWFCPLSQQSLPQGERNLARAVAGLCPECYSALVYGANVVSKLTRTMPLDITKELFSPVTDGIGKKMARKSKRIETIYAFGFALPVLDLDIQSQETVDEFVQGITSMLSDDSTMGTTKHIGAVTGFEASLPSEFDTDGFRMSLVYYSGNPSRKDIHLRAAIEDVLPSTLSNLNKLAASTADYAADIASAMTREISEAYLSRVRRLHGSVPYLLTSAYGGPYLWNTLESALHRRPLSRQRMVHNCARRMTTLAHNLSNNISELRQEVLLYMAADYFLRSYEREILLDGGEKVTVLWSEQKKRVLEGPVEQLVFDSHEELGYALGLLTRRFSGIYYARSKKDYLDHRVLIFGRDLTPKDLWQSGLVPMRGYAMRLKLRITDDFWRRLGACLQSFTALKDRVYAEPMEFMAGFWSGYCLGGKESAEKEEVDSE